MNLTFRVLKTGCALGLIALASWACDGDLTQLDPDPDPFRPVGCQPPARLLAGVPAATFGMEALRPALEHVAGPMASALGNSEQIRELIKATQALSAPDGPVAVDTGCRLLIFASRALAELPDTPETLPDREGIHLVLMMLAAAIKAETP